MSETNVYKSVVSDMTSNVDAYKVASQVTDAATGAKETEWQNSKWSQYLGYYKKIPELKKAIDALATWTIGKGFDADDYTKVVLGHVTGWGEDTFNSIMWNLFVTKKIGGDAFAEIIRSDAIGELINLKPLDPGSIKIITDEKGIIKRYEQTAKNPLGIRETIQKFKPHEILHLCNDRVADEIHGTSIIEACEWTILARNEAMEDWKKVLHRNIVPVRIIEVDTDDTTKIAQLKTQYQDVINKGEVIIVPKGNVTITESAPRLQDALPTIRYYENFFYQAVGVPKIIIGGSEEFTEASSKIAYLTFEQIYVKEQTEFEADLWNQTGLKIILNKPISLKNELLTDESKDANSMETTKPGEMQPTMMQE